MALINRDPFFNDDFFAPEPVSLMGISPLFAKDFFTPPLWGMAEAGFPGASNFRETDDSVEMLIDVPGVRPGDLKIEVEENGVRISGERKTEGSEMKFFRSFSTNSKLMDMSDAKADLVDGILTLTFAKKADSNPSPPKRNNIAITEGPSEGAEPGTGSNCKSIRKWGLPWPKKH